MRFALRTVLFALPMLGLCLQVVGPAAAQSTSWAEQFNDLRNAAGLAKENPAVDFTERPPLVVPPTYTLPPPGSGDPDKLNINDPDVVARRKALSDPRRPVPPSDPGATASGRSARTYLVDPPSGLRDPDLVAAGITHDTAAPASGARPRHASRRKKADDEAK